LISQQDFGPSSGRCVAGRDYRITNQNQVVARIAAVRSTMQNASNLNV
jgi:antitoxin (DNA-binding transcriptional repressor) of toxin-antitoxin stability system